MTAIIKATSLILFCVVVIWISLYWWFVPSDMRPDVALVHPPLWLRILAGPLMFICAFIGVLSAETLARLATPALQGPVMRAIRWGVTMSGIGAALALLRLFAPLIGFGATSPGETVALFGFLALDTLFRILSRGFRAVLPSEGRKGARTRLLGPSALELLEADARPPILYLRSFKEDLRRASALGRMAYAQSPHGFYVMPYPPELMDNIRWGHRQRMLGSLRSEFDEQATFGRYLSRLGPYVAIGRPGEDFANMDLGAAKLYVPDANWRNVVLSFLECSAAVVLEAGDTGGLAWEIEQVVKHVAPFRVLLVLPYERKRYDTFRDALGRLFPQPLPVEPAASRLVMFSDTWEPIGLDNPNAILSFALEPFAERLAERSSRANFMKTAALLKQGAFGPFLAAVEVA